MKEYYTQRASTHGSLLITEAAFIAAQAGGYANVPGIWSQPQIDTRKQITDAVQAKGSFIFLQLWALGRTAEPETLAAEDPAFPRISASNVKLSSYPASDPAPRALTLSEIDEYVALYAQAARNAIQAGFDGVEIHAANGYLIDQFLQDLSNRTAADLRCASWMLSQTRSARTGPASGSAHGAPSMFTHLISTLARKGDALVAFERSYISNADLPKRLKKDIPLTPYDRRTFYTPVDKLGPAYGYVDYPFAEEGWL
ncbi:hypothetical protein BD779DRAFT_1792269 [Infundibulicybe gibba]|nr:hypothetical protein BD779DRAFT_1792269 [Infundibulicybe gibba]